MKKKVLWPLAVLMVAWLAAAAVIIFGFWLPCDEYEFEITVVRSLRAQDYARILTERHGWVGITQDPPRQATLTREYGWVLMTFEVFQKMNHGPPNRYIVRSRRSRWGRRYEVIYAIVKDTTPGINHRP
jgi:hypothetical protein